MTDYSLIKSLQNPKLDDKTPLPPGRKYTEMKVIVEGEERTIFIPSREHPNVLQDENIDIENLTYERFKELLRKYRGIRG